MDLSLNKMLFRKILLVNMKKYEFQGLIKKCVHVQVHEQKRTKRMQGIFPLYGLLYQILQCSIDTED